MSGMRVLQAKIPRETESVRKVTSFVVDRGKVRAIQNLPELRARLRRSLTWGIERTRARIIRSVTPPLRPILPGKL